MLHAGWCEDAELIPVARKPAPGCHVWGPGQSPRGLPQVDAIAAFWGVTPGEGGDLSQNVALAWEAQALGAALRARVVLHASSVAVYAPSDGDLTEEAARGAPNAYGAAKSDMEDALSTLPKTGPRAVSLRIGSVAGAESLFASLAQSRAITLDRFADGCGPVRSYIAPTDLARVVSTLAICEAEILPPALNVAAPRPVAMADIVAAAGREVVWRDAPVGARQRVTLSTARLQSLCPLTPDAASPSHLVAEWRRLAGVPA
ncbi:NAD-dependent epimerase/dehydratase family protein [Roseivivax halodurans]|uniref:NAD-dependent epimerase/dehydratase family protein n=1 Tax=Roseivivax halodurans TaxID=93683 RepID=UPI0012FB1920|nr:NAD-dependent epimerase/dehydratase family protein [Roseivivax halodurans]